MAQTIAWWQFPLCFLAFSHTFAQVSIHFSNFVGYFPKFTWCFSLFLLYCIKIKIFGTPKSWWMLNYRKLQKAFIRSFNCTCHPTSFIQQNMQVYSLIWCPFILSFHVKSKMKMDMLLPVILSEFVDADDKKPRRGKAQESIKPINSWILSRTY